MTAIFAVWNRSGFAVAADQSITVSGTVDGQPQTFWTDVGSKLLTVEGHHLVVATAGRTTLNRVPVLQVVSRWASELHSRPTTVAGYAADFLQWLSTAGIPADWNSDRNMVDRIFRILRTFSANEDGAGRTDLDEVRADVQAWKDIEALNMMSNPSLAATRTELEAGPEPLRRHLLQVWLDTVPRISDVVLVQETRRLAALVENAFPLAFGEPFDAKSGWDRAVRDVLADYLLRFIDDEGSPAKLMFIGYGDAEWVPSQVTVGLHQSGGEVARSLLWDASTADHVWHVSLAQNEQLSTLLHGVSPPYRNFVHELLDEAGGQDAPTRLEGLVDERLVRMRSKIDDLSIPKLEFVARSFVELESLGSFLVENLPSVGGEVDVISMTR